MRMPLLAGALAGVLLVTLGGCRSDDEAYAPLRHPFRGATLLLNADTQATQWRRQHDAAWLDPITETPQARWLTGPEDVPDLAGVRADAGREGALPVLVIYYIPNLDCAGGGARDARTYARFIDQVVKALGDSRAAVILEPDAVAAECFNVDRAEMIADAVRVLADAGQYVYLDAGNSRWRGPRETAERLRQAGIDWAEGFSVNVANRQSTADSHRWGLAVSDLIGGREMVIDTSRNGLPAPADDQWCNATPQALGVPPTTDPGLERVAALLWIKAPGESDGPCGRGEPEAGVFSPAQARDLIVNTPWLPASAREAARAASAPVT